MNKTQVTLRASGIRKTFGIVTALGGVDLTINRGEVVALLGTNGAGKTTFIDLILGLTTPTDGTIEVLGMSPKEATAQGKIGAMLQTGGLLHDVTVGDTLAAVASLYPHGMDFDEVIKAANLEGLLRRKIGKCSGGEQQRLKFALAIVGKPQFLLLDEPTAGMDTGARHEFWGLVGAMAQQGTTIMFATHYLEEAQNYAERIVFLHRQRIAADGTVDEVLRMNNTVKVSATFTQTPPKDLAAITDADKQGSRYTYTTTDSDALARTLLTSTDARDLTITRASLDDIFMSLTEGE